MKKINILIEATGGLTSNYLIEAIKDAGCRCIGSDISSFNHSAYLCDEFVVLPKAKDPALWESIERIIEEYHIDVVIPSLDEMMTGWAEISSRLKSKGTHVIISPLDTVRIFQNKWDTYLFFNKIGIKTPKTSLKAEYELVKPIYGRGSTGIFINNDKNISMDGLISQEIVEGDEYTVDALFSNNGVPIYIVPRKRLDVKNGKSTKGVVVKNDLISEKVSYIAEKIKFIGPVNFQLFEEKNGDLSFIEINPRIAGGMALGFAATENWVKIMIENIIYNRPVKAVEIKYGLTMFRYYAELFV